MSEIGLKDALEYLVKLGRWSDKPEVVEISGRTYCTKDLQEYKEPNYKARPLTAHTLTALIDYLTGKSEELRDSMIIHVKSPTKVSLLSGLDQERERETLFEVETNPNGFLFDRWYDQENFIINMQTAFVPTDEAALILAVAGNVEDKTVANYGDDGMTQKATISRGIAGKEDVIVPNPVTLKPFRTFLEVDQPESKFVFRIHGEGEPQFKLIEADGGLWRYTAVADICQYIKDNIPGNLKQRITVIG